jgi:type 1 glutamine amidotransferase
MKKITIHYLLGDVHMGGHDVHRVARAAIKLLESAGIFDILLVCDGLGDGGRTSNGLTSGGCVSMGFDEYFSGGKINEADAFVFNCGNWRFNVKEEQEQLEKAVAAGAGFLLMHGDQPCYWVNAGMSPWAEFDKMAGHLWREKTSHGDYGHFRVTITETDHPIMRGLSDFDTWDEVFCTMENPYNVPYQTLAAAFSDSTIVSRHGMSGTGQNEPIAITGSYGKGRTYNQGLGHVWPYYTGHGLSENTMLSWMPVQFRIMFVRACEWIATGAVEGTKDFKGDIALYNV